jgi:hypothetical protein
MPKIIQPSLNHSISSDSVGSSRNVQTPARQDIGVLLDVSITVQKLVPWQSRSEMLGYLAWIQARRRTIRLQPSVLYQYDIDEDVATYSRLLYVVCIDEPACTFKLGTLHVREPRA